MRNTSKAILMALILVAAAATLNAAVVVESTFEYSIGETPFVAQLDSALFRLDLLPSSDPAPTLLSAPAPVMNLDPRSVVLGPSASYAAPRLRTGAAISDALFTASVLSVVALNVADYFSTREALCFPGLQEGNPLMKGIVKDPVKFAAVKIGIAAVSYIGLKSLYKKNKALGWVASAASNILLGYVVSNNYRLIGQAKTRIAL
jgi:hypothetical protein